MSVGVNRRFQNLNGENAYFDLVIVVKEQGTPNYELDLEVQWTGVDFSEANEMLCIFGGSMGSENLRVDVWTGSTWQNVITSLSPGWNNVTISTYLIASTFTIRFKGSIETLDSTQPTWAIDVALLHLLT